jgi:hypothetical protein
MRPLHWFFALSSRPSVLPFSDYEQMARVAVITAQERKNLIPHFLYDGEDNEFTEWLACRGVTVSKLRTRLFEEFGKLSKVHPGFPGIASGTFLRLEVPSLARSWGIEDPVLYTDVDVMFTGEVDLASLRPACFAVAPEFERDDYVNINAGVMLMNPARMERDSTAFYEWALANLEELPNMGWDQAGYRTLYAGQWDRLPPEYNWKPYWGKSSDARIIHFHGPKPTDRAALAAKTIPYKFMYDLATGGFEDYCQEWDRALGRDSATC